MKRAVAARYTGPQAIVVEEREAVVPGPGDVTIAVSTCGVCGTDLHFFAGRWPQPEHTPGHEIAGTITAVGEGVEGWRVGERVCVEPILPCGECRFCLAAEWNRCLKYRFISVHSDGGFASQ